MGSVFFRSSGVVGSHGLSAEALTVPLLYGVADLFDGILDIQLKCSLCTIMRLGFYCGAKMLPDPQRFRHPPDHSMRPFTVTNKPSESREQSINMFSTLKQA